MSKQAVPAPSEPPPPPPLPAFTIRRTPFAQIWEQEWANAPEDLRNALNAVDQPGKVSRGRGRGAYYQPDQQNIFMPRGYRPGDAGRSGAVWRHEYGHHLDFAGRGALPATDETATTVGRSRTQISYSSAGRAAFDADAQHLLQLDQAHKKTLRDTFDSDFENYKNNNYVQVKLDELRLNNTQVRDFTPFQKEQLGRAIRVEKLESEVYQEMRQRYNAVSQDSRYTTHPLGVTGALRAEILLERVNALPPSSIAHKFVQAIEPQNRSRDLSDWDLSNLLLAPNDPDTIATIGERVTNCDRLGQDLIGSITRNRVGRGHTDRYYNTVGNQQTEAFANIISIYGTGRPVANVLLENLSPNGFQFTRDTLRRLAYREPTPY